MLLDFFKYLSKEQSNHISASGPLSWLLKLCRSINDYNSVIEHKQIDKFKGVIANVCKLMLSRFSFFLLLRPWNRYIKNQYHFFLLYYASTHSSVIIQIWILFLKSAGFLTVKMGL
jgi:hypothetical protein